MVLFEKNPIGSLVRLQTRAYIAWVYVKSLFYSLRRWLRRSPGADPFIYK